MVKNTLLIVVKLANSPLLAAFYASIRKFLPHFPFANELCKGL
jgi:hypothetical protein